jgi:hypothetical protein
MYSFVPHYFVSGQYGRFVQVCPGHRPVNVRPYALYAHYRGLLGAYNKVLSYRLASCKLFRIRVMPVCLYTPIQDCMSLSSLNSSVLLGCWEVWSPFFYVPFLQPVVSEGVLI